MTTDDDDDVLDELGIDAGRSTFVPNRRGGTSCRRRRAIRVALGVTCVALLAVVAAVVVRERYGIGPDFRRAVSPPLSPERRLALDHIRKYAGDPASIEVVEWRDTVPVRPPAPAPFVADRAICVLFRGRNGFGALTTSEAIVYLDGDAVAGVFRREGDPATFNFYMAKLYHDREADPLGRAVGEILNLGPNPAN